MTEKYSKREARRRDTVLKAVKCGIKQKYEDFTSKLNIKEASKMGRYVSLEYISKNQHIDWDYREVSHNKELNIDYVFENPLKNWDRNVVTNLVLRQRAWETFEKNIDWKWNWFSLSYIVPFNIIDKYPGIDWYWEGVSTRDGLTEEFILRHPNKDWDTEKFGDRFSKDLVLNLPHLNWSWYTMDHRSYFHWDIVRAYPHKNWAWRDLSAIDYIPSDVFLDNIDKDWDIDDVAENITIFDGDHERIQQIENPRIRYALIGEEIEMKDDIPAFDIFAGVGGEKREQEVILYHARRHMAAYQIQTLWCRIMYDPHHPIGERVNLRKVFRDWQRVDDPKEVDRLVEEEVSARRRREEAPT